MKEPLNLYERLHARAYDIEMVRSKNNVTGEDQVAPVRHVKDADLDKTYRTMMMMRAVLVQCIGQFEERGRDAHDALEGATLSLVERNTLEQTKHKNLAIAGILRDVVNSVPEPPATGWQPIAAAPQDGTPIRVLGRLRDGRPYQETASWRAISWDIETTGEHLAPTHFMPLEGLPNEYR